jgi:two-component system, sensor histidine kinase and response regulator
VVDDEPIARATVEALLASEQYILNFAVDGPAAIAAVTAQRPDVILLDVMLPGMDGFTVCKQIRATAGTRHIPIIMFTSLADKQTLVQGLAAGADDFLTKPVLGVELRARVRSMLRIKSQYDELQRLLQQREDLVNMIVHDMRGPLTVLSLQVQVLQQMTGAEQVPEEPEATKTQHMQQHALDAMLRGINRLERMITDMLFMAKMDEGYVLLNKMQVDIVRLVASTAEFYSPIAEGREIELQLDLPDEPCLVELDEVLFIRVVENLINNALKFAASNTVVTLRIRPLEAPHHVRLEVVDQGPGVLPAYKERIFNKFDVVPLGQNGIPQVGLGLAYCKLIVEAHGGRISVEDNDPNGAIFCINI